MKRIFLVFCVALGLGALAVSPAQAQSPYTFSIGLFAGLGDALDSDSGSGSSSYQVSFNFVTEIRTMVGVRAGSLSFSNDSRFGDVLDPDLKYFSVGGEYRYPEGYFESGLYLGLGFYQVDGRRLSDGRSISESSIGLAFGATGEFELNRRFSFIVEGSGHWAVDLDRTQIFVMGHAGLLLRF